MLMYAIITLSDTTLSKEIKDLVVSYISNVTKILVDVSKDTS
jgi:hypothetical protein